MSTNSALVFTNALGTTRSMAQPTYTRPNNANIRPVFPFSSRYE